jgi:DNA-binding SARP family transcriptional activator
VILDDASLLPMRTTKVQALLNYLAAERVFAPGADLVREQIMTLLWPDVPDSAARKNLRQNLYLLRQALPEVAGPDGAVPFLLSNTRSLQVNPQAYFDLDLAAFRELVAGGEPAALAQAVDLYRGDFLQDFYLEDSNEYEEWAADHRAQLRLQALDSLEALAGYYLAQGDYEPAETYARRQITLDPLREEGHCQLIEALARAGRRSAALAAYDDLVDLLERELAVPPALPSQELAAQVRAGTVQATPHGSGHARGYTLQEQIGQSGFGTVYRAIQPAVGRDVAVKAIRRRFANDPDFIRRFETEAQMVGRLEHPHIVPLYDYWREPGGAFLVMRWMRGGRTRYSPSLVLGDPLHLSSVVGVCCGKQRV